MLQKKWLLSCYIVECGESSGLHMFNDVNIVVKLRYIVKITERFLQCMSCLRLEPEVGP